MTTHDPADDTVGQPFPPDDAQPEEREEIPRESLVASRDDQLPETQDEEALDAELGDDGQGDLALEDVPGAGLDDDAPRDLRVEDR